MTFALALATVYMYNGFSIASFSGQAQNVSVPSQKQALDPKPSPSSSPQFCKYFKFHWLELQNDRYNDAIRHIEVFMDEKGFSEANLRELFDFISKSNPEPVGLTIVVHTDWSQFSEPTPNCPAYACSECSKPDPYDHLQATYWRRQNREYFSYSPKTGVADSDFKTVVIKKQ